MSFLKGPMRIHLNGHKELTAHKEVLSIQPTQKVYIPLICGLNPIEVLVKPGDKVKIGTVVAMRNDNMKVPLFSSVSGEVVSKEVFMCTHLKPAEHLVIENDMKNEVELLPQIDYENADKQTLIDYTMNAGIVGCGGAGFPTYIKYKFAPAVHTILINAVECEPFITADYKEIEVNTDLLLVGCKAMLKMADANKVKIAIKKTKTEMIAKLKEVFKNEGNVEIVAVPDVYPMGWERTVIYEVFKKRYDKLPGEIGVIVNNATTAIALGNALVNQMPIVNKIVTVSGDAVASPQNVSVAVGTKVKDIIAQCGGYTVEDGLLIAGGPMMGKTITNDEFVITPYTNAITVLKADPIEDVACLRCGRCSDYCPAGLQPVRINNAEKVKDINRLEKLGVNSCIECGLCTYVCPSKLNVTEGIRKAKRYMSLSVKK